MWGRRGNEPSVSRRVFVTGSLILGGTLLLKTGTAAAAVKAPAVLTGKGAKELSFLNLHTDERATAVFWADGKLVKEEIVRLNNVLRDHRTGDVSEMDPALFDLLHRLQKVTECVKPYHVISGYRSPKTNAMLAANSNGVAKKSYHMKAMAIDVRQPGVPLKTLHKASLSLKGGGVGYYGRSDFIHLDTGRVRNW
jgi:uncharacterized protein YcbK (DUF882 family)